MNDGGPAYPRPGFYHEESGLGQDNAPQDGMSFWELCAVATLIGDRANHNRTHQHDNTHAQLAFNQADAMIAERNKRKEKANADS